jgi:hypothetical protein
MFTMDVTEYAGTIISIKTTSLPTISGSAPTEIGKSGVFALLFIGGKYIELPVDPITGRYSWTATEPMPDGDYSLLVMIRDRAGNIGKPTLCTLRIDTTPPEAPELLNLYDDQGAKRSSFDPGHVTDDKRPTMTGIAQKGTTVYLRDASGNTIGSALADKKTGKWVMEPSEDLKNGVNNLTLVAEEKIGEEIRMSTPSESFAIFIGVDGDTPPPGTILKALDDATAPQSSDDRTFAKDTEEYAETIIAIKTTSLPTISGSAPTEIGKSGVLALLSIGGKYVELPVDPVTGRFSWTATEPMPDGDYSLSVIIRDSAGNIGEPTLRTVRIDTTPPEAPELLNLYDDQGPIQSSFDPGQITDDNRPRLTGIAQNGTTVYLRDAIGNNIGSAVADAKTGKWVIEPSEDLKNGVNNLTLVAVEKIGEETRTGTPSASFMIVIGPDAPILPPNTITINEAIDDAGSVTGKLRSGALTDDTTPTLHGDVSAGNSVMVYYRLVGSNTWTGSEMATVNGTEWSWTPASALPFGEYEFQASIGDYSSSLFTLDIASAADIVKKTIIESVKDDFGNWQGELSSGAITDDATPTFYGRGEANGKVVLRYTQVGQLSNSIVVDVDSSGQWSWTPASDLPSGNWSFNVQPQGGTQWSETFALSITGADGFNPVIDYAEDDLLPVTGILDSGSTTNDTTPTLYGRAEANSVVLLRYSAPGKAAIPLTLVADSSGHWSWTSPILPDNNWTFEVQRTGQSDWASFSLKIDTTIVVSRPTIDNALDNVGGTSYLNSGGLTDDNTPTLNGKGKSGAVIEIQSLFGSTWVKLGQTTVNSSGNWSFTPSPLADGSQSFRAKASVGSNQSTWSNTFLLKIDTVPAPSTPVITELWDDVNIMDGIGSRRSGQLSDDVRPTFRGTATPNTTLVLEWKIDTSGYDFTEFKRINVGSTGRWEITFESPACRSFYEIRTYSVGSNYKNSGYSNVFKHIFYDTTLPGLFSQPEDLHIESDAINAISAHQKILLLSGENHTLDLIEGKFNAEQMVQQSEPVNMIDITGTGNNTVIMDATYLLLHGEKDLFIEDGKTQLVVKGNEGDVVQLKDILPEGSDISEWQHQEGTVTVAGVEYNVYSHNDAELLVQQGVKTELVSYLLS